MTEFINHQLDYTIFIYGLAFIFLALLCHNLDRKPARLLPWGWLGFFGILQGAAVFFTLFNFLPVKYQALHVLQAALFFLAGVFLVEFGQRLTGLLSGKKPGLWVFLPLVGIGLLGGLADLPGLLVASHYIQTAAALWAGWALYRAVSLSKSGGWTLRGAGLALMLYGVTQGIGVPPAAFFPADFLNAASFAAWAGFPIQLVQCLLSLAISCFLWLFARRATETEIDRYSQIQRLIVMFGGALALLLLLSLGWVITQTLGHNALREVKTEYDYHARIIRQVLLDKMKEADYLVQALAGSESLRDVLLNPQIASLEAANQVLDRFSDILPLSVCYLMNSKGKTIASSNRQRPDSFVGKNYGFRPYFQLAEAGSPGHYLALGVTSSERGYYSSYPVWGAAGQILGVAVLKRPLDQVEALFHEHCAAFFIDPHGVIFLTNRKELLLQSLWPLTPAVRQGLAASRQFGDGPFVSLLNQEPEDGTESTFRGQRSLVLRQSLPLKGWSVVHFGSLSSVTLARLLGIGITMLLSFGLMGLLTVWDLTVEATARVRKSERRYRELYEGMRDGSAAVNPEGRIVDCNPAFLQMLGYHQEEITSLSYEDITPAKWHPLEQQIIQEQVFPRGYSDLYQKEYRRQDGTIFPVELRTYLLQDEGGDYIGMWAFVRDITERCQAEEALRQREEQYRGIFESVSDSLLVFDLQGKIIDANPASCQMLGYTPAELTALMGNDLVAPEYRRQFTRFRERLLAGQDFHLVSVGLRKDGSTFQGDVKGTLFHLHGQPRLLAIVRDITQEVEAARALRESEEKYRVLMDQASEGIILADCQGNFLEANRKITEMLGYSKDELLTMRVADIHPPTEVERILRAFEDMVTKGSGSLHDDQILRKDGKIISVDITGGLVSFGGQTVMQGIFRDVSERKRTEEERARISKLESLGILAGGIAHDFNNILTAILGNISLAVLSSQAAEPSLERLAEAEKACLRAQGLARQLLTFAKGGAPIKKLTSLGDLMQEATSFTLSGSKTKSDFSWPPDLWAVEADEGQITQVVNNLLLNADQAMPAGGVIKIQAENVVVTEASEFPLPPGSYVKVTLTDQGIGIPAQYLDKIFDPYFTTKKQGSGLGLATVYAIIKNHGGYIDVDSQLGVGSVFTLYLPAVQADISLPRKAIGAPIMGQGNILIMDDDEMVRLVLGKMLSKLNYKVEFARDGAEAVGLFEQAQKAGAPFDAVILDLTVPGGMGGKETMMVLHQMDDKVKALVSSGYSDDPIMSNYRHYGFSGVIVKPYKIFELSRILHEVLQDKSPASAA